ncbi:GNAT family N-acetyltransferase [Rhizobium helianthi]|uniref:GNAT family N-acetyltransferase n=1 Tax=Rhizobium helianthi TaxID=1132695 RepID=A0ABW4M0C2_9HYPH
MEDVFGLSGFRGWGALGGWSEDYIVHGWEESGRLVASLGETRMTLFGPDGAAFTAVQFGAVATTKEARGRGLARLLIEDALDVADRSKRPVLLFANPSVLDFYPKFGFRRLPCHRLWLDQRNESVSRTLPGRILDPHSADDRDSVRKWIANSSAGGGPLSAKRAMGTILWHWLNSNLTAVHLEERESLVFLELTDDTLFIADCLTVEECENGVLDALAGLRPAVELGFVPKCKALLERVAQVLDDDSFMFWRGPTLPEGLMRFPAIMMT